MSDHTLGLTVQQLSEWKANGISHQLIDIRESYEVETCSIGGMHIPMADIPRRLSEIRTDIPVIIHCKSGRRSHAVVDYLKRSGIANVQWLEGGILGWIECIDPSLEKY